MNTLTKILFVKDLQDDGDPAERELRKAGLNFTSQRVETKSELIKALNEFRPDIIICDYAMPRFDGMQALKISLKHDQNVPVIMLTGSGRELIAVECLKTGATDYVIKEDITRLPYAVTEALRGKAIKAAADKADRALKEINEKLRTSKELLNFHLNNSPLAMIEWDSNFVVTRWAGEAEKIFGWNKSETIGKPIMDLQMIYEEDIPIVQKTMDQLSNGSSKHVISSNRNYTKGGKIVHCEWYNSVSLNAQGKMVSVMSQVLEITERKLAEDVLRESEGKLKVAQEIGRIGTWEFDIESQKIMWSDQTYKLFDRNPALGPPSTEEEAAYYTPEQVKILRKYTHRAIKEGKNFEYDLEAKLPGGRKVYFSAKMHPVKNAYGQFTKLFGTVQDITERKQAEEEIRKMKESLEKLNKYLDEIRENERALISREIHDQLGQSLTALKIDMNWLRGGMASGSEAGAKLNGMIELVTNTIADVQRISSELRPSILDDLGLAAALEWYCEEFMNRTGLQVHMELDDVQTENINKNLSIYRVLQEALTNIIRHAGAKKVQIKLSKIKNDIVLSILDDGIGISPHKISSHKSLGLLGMSERVKHFGGHMEITTPVKGGTNVKISMPIE